MPVYYRRNIFLALILIFIISIIYWFYSKPVTITPYEKIETSYTNQFVDGPIQPLPLIKSIDKNWVQLGNALFHSPLLSEDNTISCASCHLINKGGDDGFSVSVGIKSRIGKRNSPSVLNASLNFRQFWDGRNVTLNEQLVGPIHNPAEMGSNFTQIIKKLKADPTFNKAFNKLDINGVTKENIILAIATFEESLITNNSPIDLFLLGDGNALTKQQKLGLDKFQRFGCITCHQGRNIGGNLFQKIGRIDKVPPQLLEDKGRYNVTNDINDLHVYKVPSLRNVALTAPYFHDGSIETLPEAVKLMAQMQLGLELSVQDVEDIVALLNAFTGSVQDIK